MPARGESPEAARLRALREFGNRDLVKETTRDIWGRNPLHGLVDDLRAGLRTFRKNPGFARSFSKRLALHYLRAAILTGGIRPTRRRWRLSTTLPRGSSSKPRIRWDVITARAIR
jgi:hypothetical protein